MPNGKETHRVTHLTSHINVQPLYSKPKPIQYWMSTEIKIFLLKFFIKFIGVALVNKII